MRRRRTIQVIGQAAFALAVAVLVGAQTSLAAGVTWSASVQVGATERTACANSLAATSGASGSVLHATYVSTVNPYHQTQVFYRRSVNGGATWPSGATLTSNPAVWKACPTVAGAGSLVVVAWRQGSLTATAIRFRVSADGGSTWGVERRLPTTRTPGLPSVAVVGSRIVIAWTDGSGSERWSRAAVTHDRGVSWTFHALDAQPTAPDGPTQGTTLVATSGTRVFTAWMRAKGTSLVGRTSLDSGTTWQAPQVLATIPTPVVPVHPSLEGRFSIAARPDRMAIAWTGPWTVAKDDLPSIFVRVFAEGAWRAPATLTVAPPTGDPDPYGYDSSPVVTLLASARVGLVWNTCHDYTGLDPMYSCGETYGGDFDPYWTESTDNGTAWAEPVLLDPNAAFGVITSISAVWTSADLRGVLISRWNGEPDWNAELRFSRGAGLP